MDEIWVILISVGLALVLSLTLVIVICRKLARGVTRAALKKRTDTSGRLGEENLLMEVRRFSRSRHAKVLTNVYVKTANGRSTEIDLILIDRNGFFIYESKNYNGMVSGTEKQREWLHVLRNGDRFTFFNPIWQNRGHIAAIRAMCDHLDNRFFKSIIVFGRNCKFARLKYHDSQCRIVRAGTNGVYRAFRELSHRTRNCLSSRDVNDYYERLLPYSRSTKRQQRAHTRSVKKRK